ncbi:MAG: YqzL family protein [Tepidanaerobacteraceae bacterium]
MLCYNKCKPYGKGRGPMLTADFFWNIFEVTGSITAYLIYRELLMS